VRNTGTYLCPNPDNLCPDPDNLCPDPNSLCPDPDDLCPNLDEICPEPDLTFISSGSEAGSVDSGSIAVPDPDLQQTFFLKIEKSTISVVFTSFSCPWIRIHNPNNKMVPYR
jgi:hypothetical protein